MSESLQLSIRLHTSCHVKVFPAVTTQPYVVCHVKVSPAVAIQPCIVCHVKVSPAVAIQPCIVCHIRVSPAVAIQPCIVCHIKVSPAVAIQPCIVCHVKVSPALTIQLYSACRMPNPPVCLFATFLHHSIIQGIRVGTHSNFPTENAFITHVQRLTYTHRFVPHEVSTSIYTFFCVHTRLDPSTQSLSYFASHSRTHVHTYTHTYAHTNTHTHIHTDGCCGQTVPGSFKQSARPPSTSSHFTLQRGMGGGGC